MKDPRLARRPAASTPHDEAVRQSTRQIIAEDSLCIVTAVQDAQRRMQNIGGLEAKKVAKTYQMHALRKKLREKEECLEKNAPYLKSYPAIKKTLEKQIEELRDEIGDLDQTVQRTQSDIAKEVSKFDRLATDLNDAMKKGSCEPSISQDNSKFLQDRVKRSEELLDREIATRVALDAELKAVKADFVSRCDKLNTIRDKSVAMDVTLKEVLDRLAEQKQHQTNLIEEREGKDQALESYMTAKSASEKELRAMFEELSKNVQTLQATIDTNIAVAAQSPSDNMRKSIHHSEQSLILLNSRVSTLEANKANQLKKTKELEQAFNSVAQSHEKLSAWVTGEFDTSRKQQKESENTINELRATMEALIESLANVGGQLQDATEKYQRGENRLWHADEGAVSIHERKLESIEIQLKALSSIALLGSPASSHTRSNHEIIARNVSDATALEQENVDVKIQEVVKPLRELLQAHDDKLARTSQLELDLNRILAGLGMEHVRHSNGSQSNGSQSNGSQSNVQSGSNTSGIHYTHIPQNKSEELEERIQVISQGLDTLHKQHQQLTTTNMCKAMVAKIREMYPDIFPATKKEIDNIRCHLQSINNKLNEVTAVLNKVTAENQRQRSHMD